MRVRATKTTYCNDRLYHAGDEFELPGLDPASIGPHSAIVPANVPTPPALARVEDPSAPPFWTTPGNAAAAAAAAQRKS